MQSCFLQRENTLKASRSSGNKPYMREQVGKRAAQGTSFQSVCLFLLCSLCSPPMAAWTNSTELSGFKQHTFIVLQFSRSEVSHRSHWAKVKCQRASSFWRL